MARLYVCNATGQNRIVNYRLDYTVDNEGRRTSERLVPYKSIMVPARTQMPFGGDLHPMQISEIVQQIEKTCGAVAAENIRTAKRMGVVKMVWQQDRPISRAVLKDVVDHNMGLLSDQGAERRRTLALAVDMQMTDHTAQFGMRAPAKLEMEFEGVEEDENLPDPSRLTEGLRVAHRPAAAPEPRKVGRPRKAA